MPFLVYCYIYVMLFPETGQCQVAFLVKINLFQLLSGGI